MNAVHPKVKVPAAVLGVLSLLSVIVSAVAGAHTWPWAAGAAGFAATVVQAVSGYLTSS